MTVSNTQYHYSTAMSEITIWRIQFLMNNRWEFGALIAGDIELRTADLFVGAHQFILSLHRGRFTRLSKCREDY